MGKKAAPTRMAKSGNGHRYYLDGESAPGVTTILGNGIPKPALQGWAANTTAEFVVNRLELRPDGTISADQLVEDLRKVNADSPGWAQEKLGDGLPRLAMSKVLAGVRFADRDAAARRGTEVHTFAERLARGEEVEAPEAIAGHVGAYVDFLNHWEPTNALLERVVINRRWGYMGKLDMIADFPGKVWTDGPKAGEPVGRGLLDVKTSRSGIFPEVALQLEGYRNAETMIEGAGEIPMPPVDWVGAIHVRSDGYDVFSFDTDATTFRIFLYAKQIGDWLGDNGASKTIRSDSLTPPAEAES